MLELRALLAGAGLGGCLRDGPQGGRDHDLPSVRRNDAGRAGGVELLSHRDSNIGLLCAAPYVFTFLE